MQVTHVPYKGAAPGMTAVMSGEADLMFNALPLVKQDRLHALGIGSRERNPFMPSVPTIAEAGFDYEYEACARRTRASTRSSPLS